MLCVFVEAYLSLIVTCSHALIIRVAKYWHCIITRSVVQCTLCFLSSIVDLILAMSSVKGFIWSLIFLTLVVSFAVLVLTPLMSDFIWSGLCNTSSNFVVRALSMFTPMKSVSHTIHLSDSITELLLIQLLMCSNN